MTFFVFFPPPPPQCKVRRFLRLLTGLQHIFPSRCKALLKNVECKATRKVYIKLLQMTNKVTTSIKYIFVKGRSKIQLQRYDLYCLEEVNEAYSMSDQHIKALIGHNSFKNLARKLKLIFLDRTRRNLRFDTHIKRILNY
uniref:Uncharacterized protein n=1 Tax=Romanomermis culicivorax TaxID=13658 RepID=A0A915J3H3_ROMCU